ncbi:MAG: peroxiredoxin family protein [Gammaproteobacteria bacterium]|nr:peroxiredoxin family protein [Gammaproteobacteria bacterium]NNF49843.1 redoxin domain-containing protein [Woeseiaceae bacterium]MBT8094665.1 peroxiredoxin family protein [Gammaproteobacteria bacterium]MBT8105833.1 peroxiredoxin family protein [Gammaproteobacteria bacterium]NNK25847.1 redoxin domain-containing protein [Woeseiaceae bacterium]
MSTALIATLIVLAVAVAIAWFKAYPRRMRATPPQLRKGSPLPDFGAVDEQGEPLRSTDLQGAPAVILFVRGNWCPFCTRQVDDMTRRYRDIVDLGARLVFVTPKPLETTRRVAEFFRVDFDFWLDEGHAAARKLGLFLDEGVPSSYGREYGPHTLWPAAIVTDAGGVIRYVELSRQISDRPDPRKLLREIRKALRS